MSTVRERLREWLELGGAKCEKDDPSVAAGRAAEHFLRTLIESNLKYRGACCFLGKRVPSRKHRRRFEVDLIVLTKRLLYFLEVKNWSGELIEDGANWVQIRRSGDRVYHPNLTEDNSEKRTVVAEYLRTVGIELGSTFFSQKTIFMNPRLRLAPGIAENPDVVPRHRLNDYLATQRGTSYAERFVHSVVELCLASETSQSVLKRVFKVMPGAQFAAAQQALSSLETWDKLVLWGGKVLTGDCLKLITPSLTVDLKSLPSGTRCKISWTRSRAIGLLQSLVTAAPLGRIRLPDNRLPIKPMDVLKFHNAGEEKPCEVLMRNVDMVIRG
jgi:hypothetical protein